MTKGLPWVIQTLREAKEPQIRRTMVMPKDGRDCFCALGLLGTKAGIAEVSHWQGFKHLPELLMKHNRTHADPDRIGTALGLTRRQINDILYWNDTDKPTFAQIADKLERGETPRR